MKPLVTAVLVANGDSEYLSVTLAALRNQTRPVDRLLLVDTSSDRGLAQITLRGGESLIQTGQIKNLAAAIWACQPLELVAETAQNWLWLLHDDSAPTATALELLLRTAEVSPSVAAIGPKLVDWNNPRRIQQLGLTLTPGGEIFSPVSGELDQAQHDALDDVLAISTAGMLIRTDVYAAVGGLDAGAPNLAADVELCVRVRRAGHRVAVAPEARVAHAGLSLAGQRPRAWLGGSPRTALRRANAHLRIAYSPLLIALLLVVFAPVIGVLRAAWAMATSSNVITTPPCATRQEFRCCSAMVSRSSASPSWTHRYTGSGARPRKTIPVNPANRSSATGCRRCCPGTVGWSCGTASGSRTGRAWRWSSR